MQHNPYAPRFEDLPEILPVFPLSGVLLLPFGHLPLNIFEPRYLKMVEDALAGNRMIGMIQPKNGGDAKPTLFDMGCMGKIVDFSETEDGRYLITLCGISRFNVVEEMNVDTPYRQVRPNWSPFAGDMDVAGCLDIDRKKLYGLLESYFEEKGFECEWEMIEQATDGKLITCLSMICPFDAKEKQALLEAPCCKTRSKMFKAMLEMALHEAKSICGSRREC